MRSLGFKALLFAGTALLVSMNVHAQPVTDPALGGCPADSVGRTLSCGSNDVEVALVTASDAVTRCRTGDTATLSLDTVFEINASSARHDVATWIPTAAELGKNMLLVSTGTGGGPEFCISKALIAPIYADDDPWPLVVEHLDGDNCGDVNGVNAVFTRPFTSAEIACEGAVGGAEVDALVSWHTGGNNPLCVEHKDYGDFNSSKCSYTTSFVDLVVVGRLEVCKAAAEGTDGDFDFVIETGLVWVSGTGDDPEPVVAPPQFVLNPINGTGGVVCTEFDVLTTQPDPTGAPDPVTNPVMIFETGVPEGSEFQVSDISCVNNTPGGGEAVFTELPDGFEIMLTEGDLGEGGTNAGQSDVTCTFTNTEGGSLTIVKDAVPDGTQVFSFSGDLGPFDLDDDGNGGLPTSATFDGLEAGLYAVAEAPVTGWTLTGASCEDGEGPVASTLVGRELTVVILQGQNVSCTFTNVQQGIAIVRKEVFPADDITEFTFTGDVAGSISGGNEFSLTIEVPPAAGLTSTETVPDGWDLVSVECDDGNSVGDAVTGTATFNVEPGEVVTCVFTNIKQGSIVVEKVAIGDDDEFFFTRSWDAGFSIVTTGGAGSLASVGLSASDEVTQTTYSVVEETGGLDQARWTYDGVECVGEGPEGPTVEVNTAIDLDPGETVTCTFTNTKWASILVIKEALGFDGEFCFDFTTPTDSGTECFSTIDGYFESGDDDMPLGFWSIVEQESLDGSWVLSDASCTGGNNPSGFEMEAGEDVVCTFVNVLVRPIPVNNPWALLLMVLTILAAGWYFRPAAMRKS